MKNYYSTKVLPAIICFLGAIFLPSTAFGQSCTNPTATAAAIQPSCVNDVPQSDGYLQLSAVSNGDRVAFSTGSTFTGDPDYANATPIGTLPFVFAPGQTNPTGSQDYTIRVFNTETACFTDVTVTMQQQDCTVGCDCEEKIYLNGPTSSSVYKFNLDPTDGSLTEITNNGNRWYPGLGVSELPSPHGIAADLNGNLYIAETDVGDIRRITCDGVLAPESDFQIANPGRTQNIFSIGNVLYTNSEFGPSLWDLCTAAPLGQGCLADASGNPMPSINLWGLHYNPSTNLIYATSRLRFEPSSGGQGGSITNPDIRSNVWVFSPEEYDAAIASGDCIDPLISQGPNETPQAGDNYTPNSNGSLLGVTSDNDGNIYIVKGLRNGFQIKPDFGASLLPPVCTIKKLT